MATKETNWIGSVRTGRRISRFARIGSSGRRPLPRSGTEKGKRYKSVFIRYLFTENYLFDD